MSELENIARDMVRHEEERQAEKIKLESEIKALKEVLAHGISTKFVEEEVIYVYSPKTAHEMREKLEENYKQLHTQLTIPKSIADILDNVFNGFTELQNSANSLMIQTIFTHYEPETPFYKWLNKEDNSYNISVIYLAGKALGVDLVKVVEG